MTAVSNIRLTQEQIVTRLRSKGYDVSLRTLRYWRSVGLLPQLSFDKKYSSNVLNSIQELCDKSGRMIGDVISVEYIEDEFFKVYGYRVTKPNNKYQIEVYTDKGTLIRNQDTFKLEFK